MATVDKTPHWGHPEIVLIPSSSHNEVHLRHTAAVEAAVPPRHPDRLAITENGNSPEIFIEERIEDSAKSWKRLSFCLMLVKKPRRMGAQ